MEYKEMMYKYRDTDLTKENLGEMKQSSLISPLIIKDHQLNFEPLKTFTLPTLSIIKPEPNSSCLQVQSY